MLDTPNSRSVATPRGGGLSIVVCFLVVIGIPRDIVFTLIGDVTLRQKMGSAGRRALAESEFGIEKVAEVHLVIHRELPGMLGT